MSFARCVAAFVACLLPASAYAVTINYAGMNHLRQDIDPNLPTITTLNPDLAPPSAGPILLTDPSQGYMDALTSSLAANDWFGSTVDTFNWVGSANGIFYIDVYRAVAFDGAGAAQLLLRYERGPDDPAVGDLFWIQTVDTSLRGNNVPANESIPYVDVYASSYPAGAKQPFYFRPDETDLDNNPFTPNGTDIRSSSYNLGAGNLTYDIAFWDQPSRPINNYWRGELFLAYYDDTTDFVQILDGVGWGFDVVDEPPATLFLAVGLMLLLARRMRRRART